MSCIFCKIIDGDIPSYKIYEDQDMIAFLDISQTTKGHTLVVPKKHTRNIYEMDEVLASTIFKKIPMIANAIKKAFNPIGLNIINNNELPLQSVDHFHIHLIPRYHDDTFDIQFQSHQNHYDNSSYLEVLNKIIHHLS